MCIFKQHKILLLFNKKKIQKLLLWSTNPLFIVYGGRSETILRKLEQNMFGRKSCSSLKRIVSCFLSQAVMTGVDYQVVWRLLCWISFRGWHLNFSEISLLLSLQESKFATFKTKHLPLTKFLQAFSPGLNLSHP